MFFFSGRRIWAEERDGQPVRPVGDEHFKTIAVVNDPVRGPPNAFRMDCFFSLPANLLPVLIEAHSPPKLRRLCTPRVMVNPTPTSNVRSALQIRGHMPGP